MRRSPASTSLRDSPLHSSKRSTITLRDQALPPRLRASLKMLLLLKRRRASKKVSRTDGPARARRRTPPRHRVPAGAALSRDAWSPSALSDHGPVVGLQAQLVLAREGGVARQGSRVCVVP